MHIGDMYSYAIVCHALAKAGKPLCFNRLESMAVRDGVYNSMLEEKGHIPNVTSYLPMS